MLPKSSIGAQRGMGGGQCGEHCFALGAHTGVCVCVWGGRGSSPTPTRVQHTRVCAARSRFALAMGAHLLTLHGERLFGIYLYSGSGLCSCVCVWGGGGGER